MDAILTALAAELNVKPEYVENVVNLMDEGNTIPFIARYRKEQHGGMDDTTLRTLADRLNSLRALEQRKMEVKRSIENQGKLTDELAAAIDAAKTQTAVEDLYRPYKQKRRTRATVARERGLEPLAMKLLLQQLEADPEALAAEYLTEEVPDVAAALQGANDILAETFSDDADIRSGLRDTAQRRGEIATAAAGEEDSVYRLYYDFHQSVAKLQGHQILAINRGEREGFLKVSLRLEDALALGQMEQRLVHGKGKCAELVRAAVADSYSRLIFPSLEREIRNILTERASEGAIKMFALNLRPLLMQPPVKGKVTMGLDPGYAHGCKIAVIDGTGKVLDTTVVYPTFGDRKRKESIDTLKKLILKYRVCHLAIGNGTASRETEAMAVDLIHDLAGTSMEGKVSYAMVNEAGASVYSASKLAAEEFPQFDVNLRSAVSIARRLQDPLAELVKIDPKAIGVGQYQHDMPQARLDETLSGVVEDCVNAVGVDLNTASPSLLQRVSGLNAVTAKNIVKYREDNGIFTSRSQLKKVPRLGPKAYEQCAGFLRVPESANILDNTGVHPESYDAAKKLLSLCGYTVQDVENGALSQLTARFSKLKVKQAEQDCGAGAATLVDIVKELLKPGRDPRDELPRPVLRTDVLDIKDLKPGMQLTGTVRNVIDFGVFVDIGVHQDGLVHISQVADRFIRHPSEVVSVGDVVDVVVLDVDEGKKRISLSMKQAKKQ